MWLLLHVPGYRDPVQLDFRQFLMMVVLLFSFNFDTAVGRGKDSINLFCHLETEKYVANKVK